MSECKYCGSTRTVPVVWKRIERSPTAGNKYRNRCLDCWRWLKFRSETDWENSPNQMVLPADADHEQPGNLMTLEEWEEKRGPDYRQDEQDRRLRELKQRISTNDHDEKEQTRPETKNVFQCPNCPVEHTGYPQSCPNCGVPYEWPEEAEANKIHAT